MAPVPNEVPPPSHDDYCKLFWCEVNRGTHDQRDFMYLVHGAKVLMRNITTRIMMDTGSNDNPTSINNAIKHNKTIAARINGSRKS